jgi:outer membrane beta-barrel protein
MALALGVASSAWAQRQPLSEQPAVRHKFELRDKRFEIVPTFEASVAAEFKHTLSGGLRLEYHLTDSLSIHALGFFGTSLNTGLLDQIIDSLPPSMPDDEPTPSQAQALEHANTIPIHGGAGLTFTPWFGKLGLFGRAFLSYDIYFSGGFGFGVTKNEFDGEDDVTVCDSNCMDPDPTRRLNNDPRNDGPHNAGFNPGVQFGGGLHLYFSNFAGLDLYLRNYMFTDNPSGFDVNNDRMVTAEDRKFISHLFVGVGISLFIPPRPNISK